MTNISKFLIISFLIIIFAGCSNRSSSQKIGFNTYTASQFSRYDAFADASYTCESRGHTLKVLKERKTADRVIVDYTCLDTKSKEYREAYPYKINPTEDEKVIFKI